MKLTEMAVRRPVTGIMAFIALTILGIVTFGRLQLDMLPDIEFPIVGIITTYQGTGPESIELLVTRPIEEAVGSVQNVENIYSTSSQDFSLVIVEFAWGTDMQRGEEEVRRNLEVFAEERLPDDVGRSLVFAFDPSLQPTSFIMVNAPGTPENVRKLAEDVVEPFLARVPGVAAAEVMGGAKRQIHVRLLPEWLEAYGIAPQQIVNVLRASNVVIPGGRLEQGAQEMNIATRGEVSSIAEIREITVGQKNGVPVLLDHVAEVVDGFEEQTSVVRANGQSAVMMALRKQSDANTVQVSRRVERELERIESMLPEGASLQVLFDQALPITRSISNLASTAMIAILLTAAVLLAFLRSWRTSTIVLVSIPLSLLATFTVMDYRDVTLNIISMAGLVLAVGLLVDNSIVVLENIFNHLRRGSDPKKAAVDGTSEMAMPITASTFTSVAVFAPILFVPGLAGQLFRDMSLTIVISLLCSLLVALTLVPLLASLLVGSAKSGRFERFIGYFTSWIDPLSGAYGRFMERALHHKWKIVLVSLGVFGGSMALIPLMGIDFMAQTDEGFVSFRVDAGAGSSVSTTDEVFREMEAIVEELVPEAEMVAARFGAGEGISALMGQSSHSGTLQIRLPPRSERDRGQQEIEDVLRRSFTDLPGVEITSAQGGMMGIGGALEIKIFGEDLAEVREYGLQLASHLQGVEGATDIEFSMEMGLPELAVELDRDQLRALGLTPADVAATISTYFLGTTATMFRDGAGEYAVNVRAPREVREDIQRLRSLPVVSPMGVTVPLETVASVGPALGATSISRENQRRVASVSLNGPGVPLATLIQRVDDAMDEMGRPPGITTTVAGAAEDLADSFRALFIALLAAVVLVYMVMASQFESLLEPFVILFSVPLAAAGVVLALVITDTTLQVTALIGMILLSGIVVNNAIVLIDVLKRRRLEGMDLIEAAAEAGRMRLRPILMTALTTILGMTPLALELGDGAEIWAPMGRAVIGGMMLSTLLTLIVVPTGYVILGGWADRRRAKKAKKRAARMAAEPLPAEG